MCHSSDEVISLCDSYSLANREFFFDRSPRVFELILCNNIPGYLQYLPRYILGIYRKGELHLPSSMCPRDFLGELDYWGLSTLHLGIYLLYCFTALSALSRFNYYISILSIYCY